MIGFTYNRINAMDYADKKMYWFDVAIVESCKPIFDFCEDNYQVEQILRKEKVILPNNKTDTESCALVVHFSSRKSGEKFIDRLNYYLTRKFVEL